MVDQFAKVHSAVACLMQSLLELVANEISSDSCKQDERLQKFFSNSMEHLKVQKDREGDLGERYAALKL